uniref:Uncharacterized protein n=1 Tax=Rhizophora mucronata TaxID=61149 RepID=A0A2P2IT84_RHIMU
MIILQLYCLHDLLNEFRVREKGEKGTCQPLFVSNEFCIYRTQE